MKHRMNDETFAALKQKAGPSEEEWLSLLAEAERGRAVEFKRHQEFTRYGVHMETAKTIVEKLRARAAVCREARDIRYSVNECMFAATILESESRRIEEMLSDIASDAEAKHVLNLPPHSYDGKTPEEIKALEKQSQEEWAKAHPEGFPETAREAQKRKLEEAQRQERSAKRGD